MEEGDDDDDEYDWIEVILEISLRRVSSKTLHPTKTLNPSKDNLIAVFFPREVSKPENRSRVCHRSCHGDQSVIPEVKSNLRK